MRVMGRIGMALALGLASALAGCGSPADKTADGAADSAANGAAGPGANASAEAPPAAAPAEPSAPPAGGPPPAFAQCMSCHAVQPGKNGVGPSLAGVFGRKAGEAPGYAYSAGLKAAGLTWDAATLDKWLDNPKAVVPDTKMVFFGIKDAALRQQMIAYLETLK